MATKYWIGGTSTDPTTASNWRGGSLPATGDAVSFTGSVAQDNCVGDLTNGGTIFLQSVNVDPDFYTNYTLGSASTRLTVSMLSMNIDARGVHAINTTSSGGSTPFYIFFKEPSGSEDNTSLTINEQWNHSTSSIPSIGGSDQRRQYDFTGYVGTVKAHNLVGTGFNGGMTGPSFKWATTDTDTELTGFATLSMEGQPTYGTKTTPPDGYVKEMVQIGPWGTNPAPTPDMSFKWIHCAKIYVESIGDLSVDANNTLHKYTNVGLYNTEWTPQTPTSFDCLEGVAPLTGRGVPKGTERAKGLITVDGTITDAEEFVVGSKTFVFRTATSSITSEAASNGDITIDVSGSPTAAQIATQIIKAINSVNTVNQKTIGAGAGTSNQYWDFEAYNDSDPSNNHYVRIRSRKGGTAGNATITTTATNVTVTSTTGGSSTASTTDPYSLSVSIEKLSINAYSNNPITSACDTGGAITVYAPSEIDRLEMDSGSDIANTGDTARIIFETVSLGEFHIIHDGYYAGGFLGMSAVRENGFIIDHGDGSTPTGGLQWRADMDVFDESGWDTCWSLDWQTAGCELFIDAADLTESNPIG